MELNITGRQTGEYKVTTPVYEGPLDLLLHLIEHAELDITIVSLAHVTDQYLAHIHALQVPPDEISAFLVIAAKLIQIKSEALLPKPPVREKGEESIGELLARQLRIYKQYKEAAAWLGQREAQGLRSYLRAVASPKVESRIDLTGVTLLDLQQIASILLSESKEKAALGTVITAPRITIREKIAWIISHLDQQQAANFSELLGTSPSRLEIVVTFLALLELVKRYRVSASQENLFSDIKIQKTETWDDEEEVDIEFE